MLWNGASFPASGGVWLLLVTPQLVKKSLTFYDLEDSAPCSQEPVTGPWAHFIMGLPASGSRHVYAHMSRTSQTVDNIQHNISVASISARVPALLRANSYRMTVPKPLYKHLVSYTEHLLVGGLPSGKKCDLLFCLDHKQMALRSLHYGGSTVPGLLFLCGSFVSGVLNSSQRLLFHIAQLNTWPDCLRVVNSMYE